MYCFSMFGSFLLRIFCAQLIHCHISCLEGKVVVSYILVKAGRLHLCACDLLLCCNIIRIGGNRRSINSSVPIRQHVVKNDLERFRRFDILLSIIVDDALRCINDLRARQALVHRLAHGGGLEYLIVSLVSVCRPLPRALLLSARKAYISDTGDLLCRRTVITVQLGVVKLESVYISARYIFLRTAVNMLARSCLFLRVVLPRDIACIGRLIRRVRVRLSLHARIVGRDKVLHVLCRVLALLIRAANRFSPALTQGVIKARESVCRSFHAATNTAENAANKEVIQNLRRFQLAVTPTERLAVVDHLQRGLDKILDHFLAALFNERQRDLARRAVIEPRHRALDDAI